MGSKSQVGVGSICLGKIGNEVIEASVMGVANGTNGLEELIRGLGCLGGVCNKTESIFMLILLVTARHVQKETYNLFR